MGNTEQNWLLLVSMRLSLNAESHSSTHETDRISWSAYHIDKNRHVSEIIPAINASLPVLDNYSNDVHFQCHVMEMAMEYTDYINPGQTAVGCSDQPLYA